MKYLIFCVIHVFVICLLLYIGCDNKTEYKEYNPVYCVNTCIESYIIKMDDSSFSQNQFNNLGQIVEYCNSLKIYRCEGTRCDWCILFGFNPEKLSSYKVTREL